MWSVRHSEKEGRNDNGQKQRGEEKSTGPPKFSQWRTHRDRPGSKRRGEEAAEDIVRSPPGHDNATVLIAEPVSHGLHQTRPSRRLPDSVKTSEDHQPHERGVHAHGNIAGDNNQQPGADYALRSDAIG